VGACHEDHTLSVVCGCTGTTGVVGACHEDHTLSVVFGCTGTTGVVGACHEDHTLSVVFGCTGTTGVVGACHEDHTIADELDVVVVVLGVQAGQISEAELVVVVIGLITTLDVVLEGTAQDCHTVEL
jgi:hypothetical protein